MPYLWKPVKIRGEENCLRNIISSILWGLHWTDFGLAWSFIYCKKIESVTKIIFNLFIKYYLQNSIMWVISTLNLPSDQGFCWFISIAGTEGAIHPRECCPVMSESLRRTAGNREICWGLGENNWYFSGRKQKSSGFSSLFLALPLLQERCIVLLICFYKDAIFIYSYCSLV